jgi:hypothetical protein
MVTPAGAAQQMRTRTRNRAISRLIENHRAEFDSLVAEERQRAEAWQSRLNRPERRPAGLATDELLELRHTILTARRQATPRRRASGQ